MVSKLQQGGVRSTHDKVIKEVSARKLENGKWQGIFTHLTVNPAGNIEIEIKCPEHRDTEKEALEDAKKTADEN